MLPHLTRFTQKGKKIAETSCFLFPSFNNVTAFVLESRNRILQFLFRPFEVSLRAHDGQE